MPKHIPFSADDHLDDEANRPIGELDASYRAGQSKSGSGPIKHVPVRDASGSFTNEEPVQAYMVPSKYLTPKANAAMAPKRPLGAAATKTGQPKAVRMYSQVATFGDMNRVRRPRMAIPVEEGGGQSWMEQIRHFAQVVTALVVAGALFSWDKLQAFWKYISHQAHRLWMVLPLTHARTLYSAYRGARLRRMGMKDSHFKVVTPLVVLLFLVGLGIFSSLVGENPFAPGKGGKGGGGDTSQQGSTVLNVSPGKGAGSPANGGSQGGSGGASPQTASQPGQSTSSTGSAVQSSPASSLGAGGASPVGGYGGGSGSSGSGYVAPATIPSVPSTSSTAPVTTSGGSGGSSGGSGGSSPTDCLCTIAQPVTNTVQGVTQPVTNTVQGTTTQTTNTLNNATAPVTSTTSGLGL